MRLAPIILAALLPGAALAQHPSPPAPLGNEVGFFRPAADPALTAIRPAPRAAASEAPAASGETARELAAAEEARVERAAREHAATHALGIEIARQPPPVGSPLDGTAPIVSPLDGSAPIISPVGR